MFFSNEFPANIRFFVTTMFGMTLLGCLLTNIAYAEYYSVFAFAIIDHFTANYTRKSVCLRKQYNADFVKIDNGSFI